MSIERIRLRVDRLQAFVRESRLSQNHWAIKLGLSRGHWSDLVHGKHLYPSARTRVRLLEVLGLGFAELFEIEDAYPDAETAFKAAVADRYLIDREIGQGGMGVVYLARDLRHGRPVAVKMVSAEAVAGIGATQFLKETRTTAQLQHHHILPLFDSGVAAGAPFYVMPFIKDGSLRDLLRDRGALPLEEALPILDGIATALAHAHDAQVLHCDIKPENVLLSGRHAFVADFGIARAIHAEVLEWGDRRAIDSSAGTPAYVSPEQASGEHNLDRRSDVYSLGCMAFELLAGRPPFRGTTTMEVVAQRFTTEVPDVRTLAPDVPQGVADVIQRAMSLRSSSRPQTATAFFEALTRAYHGRRSPTTFAGRALGAAARTVARMGAQVRTIPGTVSMESLVNDLRIAFRSLRRRPAVTAVAVLMVALGVGASTAMFSVVNAVLLRPLEYPEPESVVSIYPSNPDFVGHPTLSEFAERGTFSWPEFFAVRERQTAFTAVAAYRNRAGTLAGDGPPLRVSMAVTNYELFQILRTAPLLGRVFTADDDPRREPVALLTAEFWRDRFGADSAVVGRTIQIDDRPILVVGVLPDGFRVAPMRAGIWIPHTGSSTDPGYGNHNITGAIARLAPGRTAEQAREELAAILHDAAPANHGTHGASVFPRLSDETRRVRTPLFALIAGAFLLLAVGCGNVAAILLGAGIEREQELAIRGALGAGRWRIARQLLMESLALSLVGGVFGIAVAAAMTAAFLGLAPGGLPRLETAGIDGTVLAFAIAVATAAGMVFGLIPALGLSETDPGRALSTTRSATGSKTRVHAAVVIGELALATVLMVSGALLTRTLFALNSVETGFDAANLLAVRVAVPFQRFTNDDGAEGSAALDSYFQRLVDEIAAVPGVASVAVTSNLPLTGDRGNNTVLPEGWPEGSEGGLLAERRFVSVDYFATMRLPIVAGRGFDVTDDRESAPKTIVVSQGLAARAWPGEAAVGKRLRHWGTWHTVVGVAGDIRDESLDAPTSFAIYVPYHQSGAQVGGILARTSGDPSQYIAAVRDRIASLYPDLPVTTLTPVVELMGESLGQQRYRARLMAAFAVLAAVFATLGIYGVTARAVGQRARETAIRMALGAGRGSVLRMVLQQGVAVAAIGGAIGVLLSAATSRYLNELLYGVSLLDPVAVGGIALFVVGVSVVASLPPALRATRTDPMTVMRTE